MISPEKSKILYEFLDLWPLEKVREMTYEEYTGLNDKTTFCYSVENRTKGLGTIRALPSNKFGFFRWGEDYNQNTTKTNHDSKYAWNKDFGKKRKNAFNNVIQKICAVIEAAQLCDLETIEKIDLNAWYKWKIASLYSEGRIPPIFKQGVIRKIADEYQIPTKKEEKAPTLAYIMNGVPEEECRFNFVFDLFKKFDNIKEVEPNSGKKSEDSETRFLKKASYTADKRHNIIQNKLFEELKKKYPFDHIGIEENKIDIFRESSDQIFFYEVKSSYSPTYCVREALGQVLHYAHKYRSPKKKNIIVVGERAASASDQSYLEFIKKQVTINFEYIAIPVSA
ncbi:hypothetical protein [Alkalimarinus alittae]|uniref:Protein NO VEIN C-terminal domain-containing protein n=1 Tax=Alkalimarinus alittae TaxID=2961619 RepID=A0ABY6MYD7_9ALTE|nr:hypothetical protein [Alkalimarinus alittae]UZE94815.1 hypothetical protein NKI27_12075 [Alkalimarinus alittae]